jgi:macrolide-specific efflux system membrane fusion protein
MTKFSLATRPSRRWLVVLVLALVAALTAAAWRYVVHGQPTPPGPGDSQWVKPQSRVLKTQVNATGVVRLKTGAEVRVGSQISGIVSRLFVTVGSTVTQGQVIAEIDARPIEARVQQARAQLAQARVTLSKASLDESRSEQLFEAGVISRQQLQDAAAALDSANASVQAAQSGVADASVDLEYVEIRAPISGTIASVSTQQGETVAASFATPTFVTIIQKDALEVVAMVDEADIGNVRPGEEATFTTETWPDFEFAGTVLRIAPVATIISGVVNYEVAISIRRDIAKLKPDMTANVNIITSQHRALMLPSSCVHRDEEGSFVFARNSSGSPRRQGVVVGSRNASDVEIVRGLDVNTPVLDQAGRKGNP